MWVANNDFSGVVPRQRCGVRRGERRRRKVALRLPHASLRPQRCCVPTNAVGEYYRNDSLVRVQRRLYPDRADYGREEYANCVYVNYWGYLPGHRVELFGGALAQSCGSTQTRSTTSATTCPTARTRLQEGRCQGRQPPMFAARARTARSVEIPYGCRRRSPAQGRRSNVPRNSTRRRGNLSVLF